MAPTIPKLCGVKRSVFCSLLSMWAILMLAVMWILLKGRSLAFLEDIEIKDNKKKDEPEELTHDKHDTQFEMAANNCYIALLLYTATFLVSVYHWYVYHKRRQTS